MAEKFLLEMAETIKASIPGNNIQIEDQGNKAVISGDMECGIKGINVSIECSTSTIKIKGAREYKYPITEASKDIFQQEMIKKYNGDYNIYASGQMLAFSKFFSYQTSNEAINITKNAIAAMQDMVEEFENKCVNFMEKTEDDSSENEEYNPEANVNIVNVDNNYHAVSMTEQDNQAYDDEHKSFSEEIFDKLVTSIGGRRVGNEVTVSDEESGKITRCVLFPLDAEILVSVSTNVSHDIGAMYASFINATVIHVTGKRVPYGLLKAVTSTYSHRKADGEIIITLIVNGKTYYLPRHMPSKLAARLDELFSFYDVVPEDEIDGLFQKDGMNAIDKSLRQDMMICLYDITKKDCYKQLLKNAKKSIVKRLFENGDEKQLIRFFSFGFFASKSLDNFIKLASEKEMVVLVSYLLEEQKKKSPKKSTKFNI